MVEEELENTEALRIILYRLFDHLPAPPLLDGLPTVWAAGRALAGPVIGTVTVASLPEPFRRRAGLPEVPGAQTLMQGAYLAAGLARFLPENWLRTETQQPALPVPGQRRPAAGDASPRCAAGCSRPARCSGWSRRLPEQRGSGRARPSAARAPRSSSPRCWTRPGTAIWTGPISPPWHGSCAPGSTWTSRRRPGSTTRSPQWWRELQAALDSDGDGRVSGEEYAAAVPSLAGPALIRVAEVLFEVTDADGDQFIDAAEYRALFRTGFRRTVAGRRRRRYSRSAFVQDFLTFMAGRRHSTAYDPLLTQPLCLASPAPSPRVAGASR